MQRTRILYVITKSNFGGAQKYVYELATSLDKNLFDISVALGGEGILKDKLDEAGIETIVIPNMQRDISIFKEFKVFKFLLDLFKEKKPDVVHVNSAKAGGIGSLAARLTGVRKIIFTAHGWEFNNDRSKISKVVFKFLSWLTIILSHKTIAVSENMQRPLNGWPFAYNKFTVVWNGVKPVEYLDKEEARSFLARLPGPRARVHKSLIDSESSSESQNFLDPNKKWIGTMAELHKVKGLDIFIKSAKEILDKKEDVQFLVMGIGELKEDLEKQIKKAGIDKNFLLLGYVEEAPKYLKALDMFILPSRSEALSLAIIEAGFAKLPVVATKVGGIPEIILDKDFGILVEKENEEELRD